MSVLLRQGSTETELASTVLTASSTTYLRYTDTVAGIDPASDEGDTLILRVRCSDGCTLGISGGLLIASPPDDSYILIPNVVPGSVPTPTLTPTGTPTPTPTSPPGPEPGHYTGTPSVSFDVTEDQQVCNFDITVPFSTGTCRIRPGDCAEIVDNEFAFVEEHPVFGVTKSIRGVFDTQTHVSGTYAVSMCGSTLITTPSQGTWEASK